MKDIHYLYKKLNKAQKDSDIKKIVDEILDFFKTITDIFVSNYTDREEDEFILAQINDAYYDTMSVKETLDKGQKINVEQIYNIFDALEAIKFNLENPTEETGQEEGETAKVGGKRRRKRKSRKRRKMKTTKRRKKKTTKRRKKKTKKRTKRRR